MDLLHWVLLLFALVATLEAVGPNHPGNALAKHLGKGKGPLARLRAAARNPALKKQRALLRAQRLKARRERLKARRLRLKARLQRLKTRGAGTKLRERGAGRLRADLRKNRFKDWDNLPPKIKEILGDDEPQFVKFAKRFRKNWNIKNLEARARKFKGNLDRLQKKREALKAKLKGKKQRFNIGAHPFMHMDDEEIEKKVLEPKDLPPLESHLFKPKSEKPPRETDFRKITGAVRRAKREAGVEPTDTEDDDDKVEIGADGLPKYWSWVDRGMTTDPRNQDACSSCWTFSTNALLETAYAIKHAGDKVDLSEQHLNCVYGRSICNSGWPESGLSFAKTNGIGFEDEVPYNISGNDGSCVQAKPQVRVKELYSLLPFNMTEVKEEVMNSGAVSFGMYLPDEFIYYADGIFDVPCTENKSGHAMAIVGWGEETDSDTNETIPYWIVRNSWGYWGDNGYIKIRAGVNLCSMESRYLWSAEITDDKVEDRSEDNKEDPELAKQEVVPIEDNEIPEKEGESDDDDDDDETDEAETTTTAASA